MSNNVRIITHNNVKYEVTERTVEKAKTQGIELDDENMEHILKNISPYEFQHQDSIFIDYLICNAIANRKYIGANGLFGRVVKLDKSGNIIDYFETVFEACMDSLNENSKYSFENLHCNGIALGKKTHDFFGTKLNAIPTGKEYDIISKLNTRIRKNKNIYLGRNKTVREMYREKILNPYLRMTYDDYIIQLIRSHSFAFAFYIECYWGKDIESTYTKHDTEKCGDYSKKLEELFQRYTSKNETVFEKIQDLNKVKDFAGIYVLCLPEIKGCYVGKTEKCLATRIVQHFTTPNSNFDRTYKPTDIKEIYIMQLDETMALIDMVEEDCIATLGKEICLNALAGGDSSTLIKSKNYKSKRHILDDELLQWVADDSSNITRYRRACEEDNL